MTTIAIISEYNPLHNGHIRQINKIKEHFDDASIISLTSTNFVQRGEPSIINKFDKAKISIEGGIDLFLEMPTAISLQAARYFALYNVMILDRLNIVDYLSFGIEKIDLDSLIEVANFEIKNPEIFNKNIKEYMSCGLSYKKSYELTLKSLINNFNPNILLANNILALEYIKALYQVKSKIKIFAIKRNDKGYGEEKIVEGEYQSATSLRINYTFGNDISSYLPSYSLNALKNNKYSIDDYSSLLFYKLIVENQPMAHICGYENGIDRLIEKHYKIKISDIVNSISNKRYSKSRIRRLIIAYILGLDKSYINKLNNINYIRPLYFNDKGRNLLKKIKDKSSLFIINKPKDIVKLDEINKYIFSIDLKAYKLHNYKYIHLLDREYKHKIKK